jgi:hypothetical protein
VILCAALYGGCAGPGITPPAHTFESDSVGTIIARPFPFLLGSPFGWSAYTDEIFYTPWLDPGLKGISPRSGDIRTIVSASVGPFEISNDGAMVAYLELQGLFGGDLYSLDLRNHTTRFIDHNAFLFALCPSGERVAITHFQGDCESLFIAPTRSGSPQLHGCGIALSMSNDCGAVAYRLFEDSRNRVWVTSSNGPDMAITAPVDSTAQASTRWSVDGHLNMLLVVTDPFRVSLFDATTQAITEVFSSPDTLRLGGRPAWSSDGSKVAFVINRLVATPTPGEFVRSATVFLYDIEANSLRMVARAPNRLLRELELEEDAIAFGPGDRELAFVVNRTLYTKAL